MLRKRIIALLAVRDGRVVQSRSFRRYHPVGRPEIAAAYLNRWGIDEIILVDIGAHRRSAPLDRELLARVSRQGFVPLTAGGGIRSLDDMRRLLHAGADKVCLNTAALESPELVERGAALFGRQCLVISLDTRPAGDGRHEVMTAGGRRRAAADAIACAVEMERRGAGEILLHSVDRDGGGRGFDLQLVRRVCEAVSIPVVACGGAGHPEHFLTCLRATESSGVAAGNFFHHTEHSVLTLKAYLSAQGVDVRMPGASDYRENGFFPDGRIAKPPESRLDDLRFVRFVEETI